MVEGLHIRDRDSGLIYLVTDSDISLYPVDKKTKRKKPNDFVLFAANDLRVCTFGEKYEHISLNFDLRRNIS